LKIHQISHFLEELENEQILIKLFNGTFKIFEKVLIERFRNNNIDFNRGEFFEYLFYSSVMIVIKVIDWVLYY